MRLGLASIGPRGSVQIILPDNLLAPLASNRVMKVFAIALAALLFCAGAVPAQQKAPSKAQSPAKKPAVHAAQALHLTPKLAPGQLLRYQIELRTTTESTHKGLVQDPQSASQLQISWTAVVRMEILGGAPEPPTGGTNSATAFRVQATFERSTASAKSDTFDPTAALMEKHYKDLEGETIEFTLKPDGTVTDVKGLEDMTDQQIADAARQWVLKILTGISAPIAGIVPGQHWSSDKPAETAPLAGTVAHTDSTYLRDEACHVNDSSGVEAGKAAGTETSEERCAVIRTHLLMSQPKPVKDQTPDDYRKRGLRTSGVWHGSGESLSYISKITGRVVSTTQSSTEEMNLNITSLSTSSTVHYAGKVRSESNLTLLPESPKPGTP
jgi:hypothetical protein